MDERFIVLVPGKLLLFKGPDISSKRVRYVTTLARARVEATHGQPSFQILVPNTKALSLAAASAEAAKEWIFALEDSIEYANSQGAGNQLKQADARAAQMTQGCQHRYDESYMIPHSNCFQNLELCDRTTVPGNPLRPAGPITQQYQSRPAADQLNRNGRQMHMDKGPYGQDCSGAESYNIMRVHERRDPSEYMRQNQRLMGSNFEANAQDYQAPYLASGFRNERNPNIRNTDNSYGGGPSHDFNAYVEYPNAKTQFETSRTPYGHPLTTHPSGGGSDGNFYGSQASSPGCLPSGSDVDFYNSQAGSQGCPSSGSDVNFYGTQAGRQEYPPSGIYRPNANYGAFGSHLNDQTRYNSEGGREVNHRGTPHGAYASETGNQQSSNSHQRYNNAQTPNRNKAAYDPWASRIDPKDSESD